MPMPNNSTTTAQTQGTEIEVPLDNGRGGLYSLKEKHFRLIAKLTNRPISNKTFHHSTLNGKKHIVGTKYDIGEQSLDASRALQEMNINPVGLKGQKETLKELSRRQLKSLKVLNQSVRKISGNTKTVIKKW